jgi:beta-xylosidase
MVASSFTYFPGVPVLHSTDLVNWEVVSYAVDRFPFSDYDVPQHGKGVWAPSIRYHNGYYYVYFATPDEGIFMARTNDPFGSWEPLVTVTRSKGWIDTFRFGMMMAMRIL